MVPRKMDRLARLKSRRRVWLQVHLYLGLVAGALLALIGLTGSTLVFWQEIDTWLHPGLRTVQIPAVGSHAYKSMDELIAAAQSAVPAGARVDFGYYPRNESAAVDFTAAVDNGHGGDADIVDVFVDPYTARVLGTRVFYSGASPFRHCLIGFLFKLHYSLLLKEAGVPLVGALSVFFIVSTLTGLIVWWPLTGKWRQALSIKSKASVERLNHDVHKTAGLYSALVLLAVLVSGAYFNLPNQVRWLVDRFSATTPLSRFESTPEPGAVPIGLAATMVSADRQFSEGRLYWFELPSGPNGVYTLTKHVDLGGGFQGRRQIVVDPYGGHVLHVADPLSGRGGDVFLQWQWPLHSGLVLGLAGRILVMLAGLACPLLYITGVVRWLQKRRASSHRKRLSGFYASPTASSRPAGFSRDGNPVKKILARGEGFHSFKRLMSLGRPKEEHPYGDRARQ